ncbi:MAG: ABC transporter substrate-binding protein [Planctomycetes bacterium]|nr:ABC transporter substrate-binding protein [Planctomycetota bacterium]
MSLLLALAGCTNNPYREEDHLHRVRYSSIDEDPKSLDPSFAYDSLSLQMVAPIYDTLLQYAYLKRPYALEPALADRMPEREVYAYEGELSPPAQESDLEQEIGVPVPEAEPPAERKTVRREAFRYRITIRQGLRFQDDPCFEATGGKGREVRSDDFLYAFKRIADPLVTCPVRAILGEKVAGLNGFYFANRKRIQGQRAAGLEPETDYSIPVTGLRRIDDSTFEVCLTEKYPQFLYWLAMPFTTPIPREAVEHYDPVRFPGREAFRDHPVGTGAYVLKAGEYRKGQRMVLERNPNFREERYPAEGEPGDREIGLLADAGKLLPLVDTWVFTTVKESIPHWNLFRQGYLDTSGIPREFFDRVITPEGGLSRSMEEKGVRLYRAKELTTYYFAFNMDDPVVGKNVKLRQAVSSAIHTAEYIELFLNGLGEVAQSPLPPGLFGYDPDYRNRYRRFDLDSARRLLSEAGYPGGLDPVRGQPLEIRYDTAQNDPSGKQSVRWLVRQLEALGIRLVVILNDWNTQQQKADEGNFQLIGYGWLADYPDPENFLFLLHSENRRPGVNYANYANPEYDRLFDEMKGMSNQGEEGEKRRQIIARMVRILEEDCPWVPNFHPESYSLVHSWCGGVKLHGPANNLLKYARVDPERRAKLRGEWNRPNYPAVWWSLGILAAGFLPAWWVAFRRGR